MRIVIVLRYFYCPSQPIGGAERQALRLATRLSEKGQSAVVVTGLWDLGQPRRQVIQGIAVHRHFTAWGMFDIRGLRRLAVYFYLMSLLVYLIRHRHEYDVIHCHAATIEAAVAVLAGQWLKKPTLVRSMASGRWGDLRMIRTDRSLLGTTWMLKKIREANAVVALNQQVSREMFDLGVAKERIFNIPNGAEQPSHLRRNYEIHEAMVITFVGRLHPQKGITTLLEACQLVARDTPCLRWRLQLAGTGPLENELKALAGKLAIEQQVSFLGHVDDVNELLEQSDVFVLPSLAEGMSNALLEAMAHGLPCVVTDIAGNNEMIVHDDNGWLVPPEDSHALATAIYSLAIDQELRQRLGRAAASTVATKYSLDHVAEQYLTLYAGLLHGNTQAAALEACQ